MLFGAPDGDSPGPPAVSAITCDHPSDTLPRPHSPNTTHRYQSEVILVFNKVLRDLCCQVNLGTRRDEGRWEWT